MLILSLFCSSVRCACSLVVISASIAFMVCIIWLDSSAGKSQIVFVVVVSVIVGVSVFEVECVVFLS